MSTSLYQSKSNHDSFLFCFTISFLLKFEVPAQGDLPLFWCFHKRYNAPKIHPAGAPTASGDSTHCEVQLHVVKSWPLESKPTGEAYFTSGTIKHFRTGSYSQHRALNVSSVNLWIEESSLPGLLEEEGDTDHHKQVRHWSNAIAWVIGTSELLSRSTFPLLSVLCVTRWVSFPGTTLGTQWDSLT